MSADKNADPNRDLNFQQLLGSCMSNLESLSESEETRSFLLQILQKKPQCSACPAPSNADSTAALRRTKSFAEALSDPPPLSAHRRLSSAASCETDTEGNAIGKFGFVDGLSVYPSGKFSDFKAGLLQRIGMPHLEYEKAMTSEHCEETGSAMNFTTRNFKISTCAQFEWNVVVNGANPPKEHMIMRRVEINIDKLHSSETAKKAGLRREEIIAVALYTGPM